MNDNDTFYDIHMHAFNLSHPSFTAFLKRFKFRVSWLMLGALLSWLLFIPPVRRFVTKVANRMMSKVRNLLSVMETDIGSFFLVTENCLRERPNQLLTNQGIKIGGKSYRKIVLTPLMMDFGYKGKKKDKTIHYQPGEKPIVSQVVDVFNAIRKYRHSPYTEKLVKKYPFLEEGTERVIEIYPFLGLNTANYERKRLEEMLEKYFQGYQRDRTALAENAGKFNGDIEQLKVNNFIGIKVYPPLGFDPWPDNPKLNPDASSEDSPLDKVKYLYGYCSKRGIPITSHGGTSGFVTTSPEETKDFADISKWEKVLAAFPNLKLNIAHFPVKGWKFGILPPTEQDRLKTCIFLLKKYNNVYVDISSRATNDGYYRRLRKIIDDIEDADERKRVIERILFGSDFSINLLSLESYNAYLQVFSRTTEFDDEEKRLFCSVNPERFLFSGGEPA